MILNDQFMEDQDALRDLCDGLQLNFDKIYFERSKFENGSLVQLDLSRMGIVSLPRGLFENLTMISTLDLSNNKLTELPIHIFDPFVNLSNLYILGNRINYSASNFELKNLIELKIEFNNTIPINFFENINNLSILFLQCKINLPSTIFDNLINLRTLSIEIVDRLNDDIFNNISPKFLSISRTKRLPTGIFDKQNNLEELHIVDCEFTSLPDGIFDNLTQLRVLNLSNNRMKKIQNNLFVNLSNIEEIDLSNNMLKSLPLFNNNFKLEYLNVSNNTDLCGVKIQNTEIHF